MHPLCGGKDTFIEAVQMVIHFFYFSKRENVVRKSNSFKNPL